MATKIVTWTISTRVSTQSEDHETILREARYKLIDVVTDDNKLTLNSETSIKDADNNS